MQHVTDGLVDGDGWLSDESTFYGDSATREKLERKARRELVLPFFPMSLSGQPKPSATSVPKAIEIKADSETEGEPSQDDDFSADKPSWQKGSETIVEFLRRLPVAEPSTAHVGPWLWVYNPKAKTRRKPDVPGFIDTGSQLLQTFQARRTRTENENPDKSAGVITRKMGPFLKQLQDDLLEAAVERSVTCGKWMLFPNQDDLPRYWRVVAEATAEGRLGSASKVATFNANDSGFGTLICVYTCDFTDISDIHQVLDELVALDLLSSGGKPIYYKADAYTYLDIKSNNAYKLKASLYSSHEWVSKDNKKTKPKAVKASFFGNSLQSNGRAKSHVGDGYEF